MNLTSVARVFAAVPKALRSNASLDVDGKVVLITGGGQGIGLALGKILQSRGAIVVLVDIDEDTVTAAADALGERVYAVQANVTDREAIRDAVAYVRNKFGHLDV